MATKFKITKKFQQLIIRTTKIYGPNVTRKSRVGDELLQAEDAWSA